MGLGGNTQISKGERSSVLQTWMAKPRAIPESGRDRLGWEREIQQDLERRGPPKVYRLGAMGAREGTDPTSSLSPPTVTRRPGLPWEVSLLWVPPEAGSGLNHPRGPHMSDTCRYNQCL